MHNSSSFDGTRQSNGGEAAPPPITHAYSSGSGAARARDLKSASANPLRSLLMETGEGGISRLLNEMQALREENSRLRADHLRALRQLEHMTSRAQTAEALVQRERLPQPQGSSPALHQPLEGSAREAELQAEFERECEALRQEREALDQERSALSREREAVREEREALDHEREASGEAAGEAEGEESDPDREHEAAIIRLQALQRGRAARRQAKRAHFPGIDELEAAQLKKLPVELTHTHTALPTPCTFPRCPAESVHRVWRRWSSSTSSPSPRRSARSRRRPGSTRSSGD